MRLFLLGAPCAGKTTLTGRLRRDLRCPVLDMDAELVQLNGGVWPSLETKRGLTLRVLAEASLLDHVVLAYSLLAEDGLALLDAHRWCVALLDLPESVMRERAARRERQEGWSNIEWLPTHLENIADLKQKRVFSHVLDASRPLPDVTRAVVSIMSGPRP